MSLKSVSKHSSDKCTSKTDPEAVPSLKPNVIFKEASRDLEEVGSIHSLPCSIPFTGPARVSNYFKTEPISGGKVAAFRGHLLYGQTVALPSDYKIFAVRETENKASEGTGNTEHCKSRQSKLFQIESCSKTMDFWEYDIQYPPGRNPLQRSFDYLSIMSELNKL